MKSLCPSAGNRSPSPSLGGRRSKPLFCATALGKKNAFTLVELLVVISILAVLAGVLLPAVQSAREAARRTQCLGHLQQIGLGTLLHHEAQGHYPSSGWGAKWVGMPDRGSGRNQPGSWIYNVLPYVEEVSLHRRGESLDEAELRVANASRLQTPIGFFNCPSRRSAELWPTVPAPPMMQPVPHVRNPLYTNTVLKVARSDYAINAGDKFVPPPNPSTSLLIPSTLTQGDSPLFKWFGTSTLTGISFLRSQIRSREVRDGTSKTLLVGEKSLSKIHYRSGIDLGDNESMYAGYCTDLVRFTVELFPPQQDPTTFTHTDSLRFGSAHYGSVNVVFCDGSTHAISHNIDPQVWSRLGNRKDGRTFGSTY